MSNTPLLGHGPKWDRIRNIPEKNTKLQKIKLKEMEEMTPKMHGVGWAVRSQKKD